MLIMGDLLKQIAASFHTHFLPEPQPLSSPKNLSPVPFTQFADSKGAANIRMNWLNKLRR